MRIAFLILAHKAPDLLIRLLQALHQPAHRCFVHVDAKTEERQAYLARVREACPWVHIESRYPVYWGGFSMVRAAARLMQRAASSTFEADYFFLISGQDYPIQPWERVYARLGALERKSLMTYYPIPHHPHWKDGGIGRFVKRRLRVGNRVILFPGDHRLAYKKPWVQRLHRWAMRPLRGPEGAALYGGSSWMCLHRRHAQGALTLFAKRRWRRYFREVGNPDESFFQTALIHLGYQHQIEPLDMTYTEWPEQPPVYHPYELDLRSLPSIEYSDGFFARKMAENLSESLMEALDYKRRPS
jgi:hypothetical protein